MKIRNKKKRQRQRQKRRLAACAAGTARAPLVRFSLRELVAGINSKNRHELVDFGPAVGKERF